MTVMSITSMILSKRMGRPEGFGGHMGYDGAAEDSTDEGEEDDYADEIRKSTLNVGDMDKAMSDDQS